MTQKTEESCWTKRKSAVMVWEEGNLLLNLLFLVFFSFSILILSFPCNRCQFFCTDQKKKKISNVAFLITLKSGFRGLKISKLMSFDMLKLLKRWDNSTLGIWLILGSHSYPLTEIVGFPNKQTLQWRI